MIPDHGLITKVKGLKSGDNVTIQESRPISKLKRWVVINSNINDTKQKEGAAK